MWELVVVGFVLWPIVGLWSPPVLAPAQPPNLLTGPVAVYNMMIMDHLILDKASKCTRTERNGHLCVQYQFSIQPGDISEHIQRRSHHREMMMDFCRASDATTENSLSPHRKGIAYALLLEEILCTVGPLFTLCSTSACWTEWMTSGSHEYHHSVELRLIGESVEQSNCSQSR